MLVECSLDDRHYDKLIYVFLRVLWVDKEILAQTWGTRECLEEVKLKLTFENWVGV